MKIEEEHYGLKQRLNSYLFIVVPFLLLFSCNDTGELKRTIIYKNGNKIVYDFYKDTLNSTVKVFDIYGNLYFAYRLENGLKEGNTVSYFENGKVKLFNMYKKGKRNGAEYSFYYNGNLKSASQIIDLQASHTNKLITFNKDGSIDSAQTSYFNTSFLNDTISLLDSTLITINLIKFKTTDSTEIFIGNYDSLFNVPEQIAILPFRSNNIKIGILPSQLKKGDNIFRAIIRQYSSEYYYDFFVDTSFYVK